MDLATQAAGIGALADPIRRLLYEYVVAQPEPVGREQAAAALGLAPHNVNFHLDRLVDEGLLEVEYRRLSGRTGPQRTSQQAVPPRRPRVRGLTATPALRTGRRPAGRRRHPSSRRSALTRHCARSAARRVGRLPRLARCRTRGSSWIGSQSSLAGQATSRSARRTWSPSTTAPF